MFVNALQVVEKSKQRHPSYINDETNEEKRYKKLSFLLKRGRLPALHVDDKDKKQSLYNKSFQPFSKINQRSPLNKGRSPEINLQMTVVKTDQQRSFHLVSLNNRISSPLIKPQIGSQSYSYYVDWGNNPRVVRMVLAKRNWLYEQNTLLNVNILWRATSFGYNYQTLKSQKVAFNHLAYHQEISNKINLYENIKLYCKRTNEKLHTFIPQTFIIDLNSIYIQAKLKEFIDHFLTVDKQKQSQNIWLLKPPDLNRGQGIQIFNDLKTLGNILQEFCISSQKKSLAQTILGRPLGKIKNVLVSYTEMNETSGKSTINTMSFQLFYEFEKTQKKLVIQKYLEDPFIYKGRKFDFRIWVLVDHQLNFYFFKEGYVRLATDLFSLSDAAIKNQYIHLTNNAIQKNHSSYGKYESGNQISFLELQEYFDLQLIKQSVQLNIVPRMKELVQITMYSAYEKLSQCTKQYQYEIFGFDFMLDNRLNIWLIEANTNPCIEESSPLLQRLIPRMLNDTFRLTIDRIFSPFLDSNQEIPYDFLSEFSIEGYSDQDILWQCQNIINVFRDCLGNLRQLE